MVRAASAPNRERPPHPTATSRVGRRALLGWSFAAGLTARGAHAQPAAMVTPSVQANLLAKVVYYDRNFAARAIDRAKLLLVARAGDPESLRVVTEMQRALAAIPTVGALPHDEEIAPFAGADAVARTCTSHRISIVYFGPNLGGEVPALRSALASMDILSVAALPEYVPLGIVLGFEAGAGGGAKLLVNRAQARLQNVKFGARILQRMTIYE
jgi:hypothetical protein